jgi:hypothetical protein
MRDTVWRHIRSGTHSVCLCEHISAKESGCVTAHVEPCYAMSPCTDALGGGGGVACKVASQGFITKSGWLAAVAADAWTYLCVDSCLRLTFVSVKGLLPFHTAVLTMPLHLYLHQSACRAHQRCCHLAQWGNFPSLSLGSERGLRCYTTGGEQVREAACRMIHAA